MGPRSAVPTPMSADLPPHTTAGKPLASVEPPGTITTPKPEKPVYPGQKWEYTHVRGSLAGDLMSAICAKGREGWEAISVDSYQGLAWLKRPLIDMEYWSVPMTDDDE